MNKWCDLMHEEGQIINIVFPWWFSDGIHFVYGSQELDAHYVPKLLHNRCSPMIPMSNTMLLWWWEMLYSSDEWWMTVRRYLNFGMLAFLEEGGGGLVRGSFEISGGVPYGTILFLASHFFRVTLVNWFKVLASVLLLWMAGSRRINLRTLQL